MSLSTKLNHHSCLSLPTSGRRFALSLTLLLCGVAVSIQSLPGLSPAQASPVIGRIAQDSREPRRLEAGEVVERELAGSQSHSYQIRLDAGQYLGIIVEQRGIDVVLWLFARDGNQVAIFDNESRSIGREKAELVADLADEYRLEVRSKQAAASAGRYGIQVERLREATESDRALDKARRLTVGFYKLDREGKFNEAALAAQQALEIREQVLGPDHLEVAAALGNLAIAHAKNRAIAKAAPLFERALVIREKVLGPEHPLVATSLSNLANIHQFRGDLTKAEEFIGRALGIREKSLGPEHVDVAASLNNLANLYLFKGQYSKAESLHERALAIREKAFAPDSREIAESLSNLATIYSRGGDYANAESAFQRASTIWEKILGPRHPDVLEYLSNLAVFYGERGDFVKAEPLHQRALAAKEEVFGKEDPRVAASLTNLALFYCDTNDHDKALPLFQRALAIKEKALGPDHPDVADALNNLAIPYDHAGDGARAEPLHQRAMQIYEKSFGPEHPHVAQTLNNLATLYRNMGDHGRAESFYLRAVAMMEKSLGPNHPHLIEPLNSLAKLYAAQGAIERSIAIQTRALGVSDHNLTRNLTIGSERQKLAYLTLLSEESDRVVSLHARSAPDNPAARDLALTLILRRKGCVLDAMADGLATLRRRAGAQDRELLDQLKDANSRLAKLVFDGPQKTAPGVYQRQVRDIEEQVEKLEAAVGRRSAEFRAQAQPVTVAAVQAAIPAQAVLVEFAVYRPFNAKPPKPGGQFGAPRYAVYVLRREGPPRWADLGETLPLDRAVEAWRQALRDPRRTDVRRLARAVDEQLMRPLRQLLGDARQLLLSPDGKLNLIPFAALVDETGRHLIERYGLSYLTSGRDLLRLQIPGESRGIPLVLADPIYGEKPHASGSETNSGDLLAHIFFERLQTAPEAKKIEKLMPGAEVLLEKDATEAALKQVHGPRLLHVATHGFFLEDPLPAPAGSRGFSLLGLTNKAGDAVRPARVENPLLRSGLAMAWANRRRSGDEDGVLTALEAAGLDLWGTKLVVLSACDTGVGEVRNGEGVYGLRRALVLAGSESQVVSLWKVSDEDTRDLMIAYYAKLKKGLGRGEALRRVQLERLHKRHPYYWAGFIQSGEWANLAGDR